MWYNRPVSCRIVHRQILGDGYVFPLTELSACLLSYLRSLTSTGIPCSFIRSYQKFDRITRGTLCNTKKGFSNLLLQPSSELRKIKLYIQLNWVPQSKRRGLSIWLYFYSVEVHSSFDFFYIYIRTLPITNRLETSSRKAVVLSTQLLTNK